MILPSPSSVHLQLQLTVEAVNGVTGKTKHALRSDDNDDNASPVDGRLCRLDNNSDRTGLIMGNSSHRATGRR